MAPGGMSPRKAMASGHDFHDANTGGGNFGAQSFASVQGGHNNVHPDHTARTGHKGAMADGDRAIGHSLHHTRHHHPAQAAPDHGPHHVDGYRHHDREDTVAAPKGV